MAGNVSKYGAGSKLLAIAIAAALIAACGKSDDQAAKTVAPAASNAAKPADATAAAPAASSPAAAAAPVPIKSLSVAELLKRAAGALAESRFVAPPGDNAAEYYLAVLDKDSNNNAARDGLREMFPMATGAIEQQINAGQLDEGKRAIDLMGKADPNNYALTILRGKLDLKRKQVENDKDKAQREQDKALAAAKAAAASAPATASAPAPAASAPIPAPAPPPTPVQQAPTPAPAPATAATTTAPAPAAAAAGAPAGSGESRAAKLITRVNPVYPSDAARNRQEGWVEVAFTVSAAGKVKDAEVVSATPPRIFNASALRAVQGWTFQPRLENGKPAEQAIRTRIEFKL